MSETIPDYKFPSHLTPSLANLIAPDSYCLEDAGLNGDGPDSFLDRDSGNLIDMYKGIPNSNRESAVSFVADWGGVKRDINKCEWYGLYCSVDVLSRYARKDHHDIIKDLGKRLEWHEVQEFIENILDGEEYQVQVKDL